MQTERKLFVLAVCLSLSDDNTPKYNSDMISKLLLQLSM